MAVIYVDVEQRSKYIMLGEQGEKNAVVVKFDISTWLSAFGSGGSAFVDVMRPGDETAYTKQIGLDGSYAVWSVDDTDNAVAGKGKVQLTYLMPGDDGRSKTVTFVTMVDKSLDASGDVPDPYESYLEEAREIRAETTQNAETAQAAAQEASTKAGEASTSASEAYTSARSAKRSEENAERSASTASEAAEEILSMTATATTLPEGSQATVDYNNGVMAFGIPRGDKGAKGDKGETGETGATPQMSIGTVETLEPDEDASVAIRGTAEAPILDFGIPKGDTGEVSLLELIANTKVDEKTDSVPYQTRTLSGVCSHESLRKIVGGTVAWNQLVQITNGQTTDRGITATIDTNTGVITLSGTSTTSFASVFDPFSAVKGRVYIRTYKILTNPNGVTVRPHAININWNGTSEMVIADGTLRTGSGISGFTANTSLDGITMFANIFDLTQMFGSTIADHIYSLEQAHAGDGVAFFKALFPEDYYPYDEGTLKSVQTSAHKTYDADGNVIGNYPVDSSLTLRGIPKLDSSNNLYYDGDEYPSSGAVNRRYDSLFLDSTANWIDYPDYEGLLVYLVDAFPYEPKNILMPDSGISNTLTCVANVLSSRIQGSFSTSTAGAKRNIYIRLPNGVADASTFKTWLANNPTEIVYEKATPTTETATAYTELQEVESGGTEEFVGAEIPVGHKSVYPRTLADTMPTQDGSYTLSLTVSGGKPSVEWEVNA